MAKNSLGPRTVTAAADNTGNNTGNWTAVFDTSVLAQHWTQYEIYKMVVNLAVGAGIVAFTVFIDAHQYEGFQSSVIATWSDPQPMVVNNGQTVYFYFAEPTGDKTPPTVTIWIQIDTGNAKVARD